MIPNLTQVQNSNNYIEIKYPQGDWLFHGNNSGSLQEFSMLSETTVDDQKILNRQIFNMDITSMAKTPDNKSQLACSNGAIIELDIPTRKIKSLPRINARFCVFTFDNKFLVTAANETNVLTFYNPTVKKNVLTKWSIRSKKELHTWESDFDQTVFSQSCSYDSKYQLIGYVSGLLGIFDLQKNQTLQDIKILTTCISSVAFSRDNHSAFISDYEGNIKMIKWQAGADSKDNFDFDEEPTKVVGDTTSTICLTKDEKYLIVGSFQLLSILETETRKVIKEFKHMRFISGITLIKDGKTAIIAETNGTLSIIDQETLEIKKIAEKITKNGGLDKITVI